MRTTSGGRRCVSDCGPAGDDASRPDHRSVPGPTAASPGRVAARVHRARAAVADSVEVSTTGDATALSRAANHAAAAVETGANVAATAVETASKSELPKRAAEVVRTASKLTANGVRPTPRRAAGVGSAPKQLVAAANTVAELGVIALDLDARPAAAPTGDRRDVAPPVSPRSAPRCRHGDRPRLAARAPPTLADRPPRPDPAARARLRRAHRSHDPDHGARRAGVRGTGLAGAGAALLGLLAFSSSPRSDSAASSGSGRRRRPRRPSSRCLNDPASPPRAATRTAAAVQHRRSSRPGREQDPT